MAQNEKKTVNKTTKTKIKAMRMTKHLSKWSRQSSRVVCLLAACGLMYACKDEFVLDDEKPSWLNSSIYESLEQKGNFRTYLKLLADKDVNPENTRPLTDVLNQTGSKTVFVANDSAWDAFFADNAKLPEANPWHYATSYDKLSPAQKKLLIHTSMLNNAIVMENLASSQSSGTNSPTRGEYMRRVTDVMTTDSITYLSPEELPQIYSETDKDYWERFRGEGKAHNGIYLADGYTVPMMLQFTREHMANNGINDEDFEKFMGRTRNPGDVHIYDAILKEKDGVCENGYVNVTEKPLCPLPSMAEILRTNGETNIFSHMIDRFCAPFYNEPITEAYKTLHDDFNDSIFIKMYFALNSARGKGNYDDQGILHNVYEPVPGTNYVTIYRPYKDSTSSDLIRALKFDPGWNAYYDEVDARKDMAAIFAPCDDEMWDFFLNGSGKQLIESYYVKKGQGDKEKTDWVPAAKGDYAELYKQIDAIPLGTLESLINNHMQRSFVGSVYSKWSKLTDDAMDELFQPLSTAQEKFKHSLLCSNGVLYVMDMTCMPADFRSVAAPAYINPLNKVMKSAIYDAFMQLNYYAYLKAMQSKFTLLMPSDDALQYYYDPASMKSRTPRVIEFKYNSAGSGIPVKLTFKNYRGPYNTYSGFNPDAVGTIGSKMPGTTSYTEDEVKNRLKDILETHTIVHDRSNPMTRDLEAWAKGAATTDPLDEYYLSKNGNAVKVIRDENDPDKILDVRGGFQIENERLFKKKGLTMEDRDRGVLECGIKEIVYGGNSGNGNTFIINAPIVPTYRSVYSIFTDDIDQYVASGAGSGEEGGEDEELINTPYREFYNLCQASGYDREIKGCGLVDTKKLTAAQQKSALKKFYIFFDDNGLDYNVQFFNNYRYTIFVPTNEAVQAAIANGLPTWEDIQTYYNAHCKPYLDDEGNPVIDEDTGDIIPSDTLATYADSLHVKTMITYLTNFVRYHFADNSVFADRSELAPEEMVTSSYDSELGLFCKIHVDRIKNGAGTDLRVCDDASWKKYGGMAGSLTTVSDINGEDVRNILARDVACNRKPVKAQANGVVINTSSAAVIHSIDGCLNHVELGADGRHDTLINDQEAAQKYIKRYAIR